MDRLKEIVLLEVLEGGKEGKEEEEEEKIIILGSEKFIKEIREEKDFLILVGAFFKKL